MCLFNFSQELSYNVIRVHKLYELHVTSCDKGSVVSCIMLAVPSCLSKVANI